MAAQDEGEIDFCTLGMFIIDDIYPSPNDPDQTPRLSIIGGGGTYSAIGARLLSPSPISKRVGWIIDAGTDFPPSALASITSWDTGALIRSRAGPTTKGWNGYGENEHRAFKYLTPKLRLTHLDLSPALLGSKSFHLICSPLRCIELVEGPKIRRAAELRRLEAPLVVWEPVPDLCVPAELDNTLKALRHVDVISPNHAELGALFGVDPHTADGDVDKCVVEDCCKRMLDSVAGDAEGGELTIVARSGKDGCYVASSTGLSQWLPAYHTDASKVVDPTGGGNGFLGGLAVGLVRTGDVVRACMWGNVAASFAIEQVGVPVLGSTSDGRETWNGVVVEDRLKEFERRCGVRSNAEESSG